MNFKDLVATANSNLLKNKLRTFLTIVAVFIGAFTLTLTNGIGRGVSSYFDRQIGNVGFKNSLIITRGQSNPFSSDVKEYTGNKRDSFGFTLMNQNDVETISEVDGIKSAQRSFNVLPEYITAADKKYEVQISEYLDGLTLDLSSGNLIQPGDTDGIILTKPYVDALGLGTAQEAIGKNVKIALRNPANQIKEFNLTVRGVLNNTLIQGGSLQVSIEAVKQMNSYQTGGIEALDNAFVYVIARYDEKTSPTELDSIQSKLKDLGFDAQTLEEQLGSFTKFLSISQAMLNGFGGIALVAASFGIINTLLMAVHERTREIGLMKALGMSRKSVFRLFSLEAVMIGFWGSILGSLAGMGLGAAINRVASNTFLKNVEGFTLLSFPLKNVLGVVALIMIIAFLAGALPSRRASKLDPIEALRYE